MKIIRSIIEFNWKMFSGGYGNFGMKLKKSSDFIILGLFSTFLGIVVVLSIFFSNPFSDGFLVGIIVKIFAILFSIFFLINGITWICVGIGLLTKMSWAKKWVEKYPQSVG